MQDNITLDKGDRIRFTRGGRNRPVNNNDMGFITSIDDTHIHLDLDRNKKISLPHSSPVLTHIDHGWANTAHAFQGKTVKDTIVVMPSRQSPLTTLKSLYSAISRHKNRVALLTDNASRLTQNLSETLGIDSSKATITDTRPNLSSELDKPSAQTLQVDNNNTANAEQKENVREANETYTR